MTAPGTEAPIRLLVVDDHEVVRVGLRMLLGRFADLQVVGEAADGAAALVLAADLQPDVVLMDLSMPGMDGVAATAALAASQPGARVVALTPFADREHVTAAIDAGAVGFLLKDADPQSLADAVRAAARGEAPLDPRAALALIDRRRAAPPVAADGASDAPPPTAGRELSAREREVLALVGQGLSNRLIARRLGIAEKTVKAHLTQVFAAIGVTDRVQAALWWQRHGAE
jgi:DNA-binding NarL/FixJ family response regulator